MKSILVIFDKDLPKKSKSWWRQFDQIIYKDDLEKFVKPGSVQQAYDLVNNLSRLTLSDGSRLSKLINYKGYELWWIHYETIYLNFCLPYTQYAALLSYLKDFDEVYLYRPACPDLFRYFLRAYNRRCIILSPFRLGKLLPIPLGILIQSLLSFFFLPWLKIARPELIMRTSDRLDAPYDFDFRQQFFYKELRQRNISFAEFIRASDSWVSVLRHAWQRKRPVFYSGAIIELMHCLSRPLRSSLASFSKSDPEKYFWFLAASHYLNNFRGAILSIMAMKFIVRLIGIKAAIIPGGVDRTFHEILGCKLAGIKTVGIQYGATPRYFVISDFMSEFDGEKTISLDRYGVWSEWWLAYYLKYSRAFKPEQFHISGPMRPLEKSGFSDSFFAGSDKPRVLFISEQLAEPKEVMPYLRALLNVEDLAVTLKFRPGQDGFEEWLKKNDPDLLKKAKISKEYINKAIAASDVVVGSHSTAVLEGLAQLKHCIFFWTNKWGDYFNMKSFDIGDCFFAENPGELINKIRKSSQAPKENIKKLQERLFGNPYQDGSKWVVEQAIEYAKQR